MDCFHQECRIHVLSSKLHYFFYSNALWVLVSQSDNDFVSIYLYGILPEIILLQTYDGE